MAQRASHSLAPYIWRMEHAAKAEFAGSVRKLQRDADTQAESSTGASSTGQLHAACCWWARTVGVICSGGLHACMLLAVLAKTRSCAGGPAPRLGLLLLAVLAQARNRFTCCQARISSRSESASGRNLSLPLFLSFQRALLSLSPFHSPSFQLSLSPTLFPAC
jgi:hypothetical protein